MIFHRLPTKKSSLPKKIGAKKSLPKIGSDSACRLTCFFRLLAAFSRISVFLLTCAAEKLLVSENRLTSGFQERVGGIGGSRVQSENPMDFRRTAFPPREGRLCRHSQSLPKIGSDFDF